MKGKNKYIVPLLLAGVTATAGVVSTVDQHQQTVVQADAVTVDKMSIAGAELQMEGGFNDIDYTLGQPITMPNVTISGGEFDTADIVYTISRGGKTIAEIKGNAVTKEFTPYYTGAYDVSIRAEKDGVVVSEINGLTIMVDKADASIKLPTNSDYVIPAQLSKDKLDGLKIPAPSIITTDAQGQEKTLSATEAGNRFKVKLLVPNSNEPLTLGGLEASQGAYYQVDLPDSTDPTDDGIATGTYQIRYEYYDTDGKTILSKLESNFQVVKKVEAPTKLYLKMNGSVPSTGSVNTSISLPKVTVLDSASATDGINAHVVVTVNKIDNKGKIEKDEHGQDKTFKITDGSYSFKPAEEGNYVVIYKADLNSIYTGCESDPYQPATIIKVSDNTQPTVMPTYPYNVSEGKVVGVDKDYDYSFNHITDAGGQLTPQYNTYNYEPIADGVEIEDVLVNRKAEVPSVVVKGDDGKARFRIPAIFGTDNKDSYSDLKFTREIVGNNITKITVDAPANQVSEEIVIGQTGNYEIRYIATDKAGKTIRATYSLVVKEKDSIKDGKTNIKLNVGVASISDKETLRFAKPTVKDTYDSELGLEVGYRIYVGDQLKKEFTLDKMDSDGKYAISIAKDVLAKQDGATKVVVYAKATADIWLKGTRTDFDTDTITEVTREVSIVDSKLDQNSAILTIGSTGVGATNDAAAWNTALLNLNNNTITTDGEEENNVTVAKIGVHGYALSTNNETDIITTPDGKFNLAPFDQANGSIVLPTIFFQDKDENLKVRLTIEDRFGNTVSKESYEKVMRSNKPNASGYYEYEISKASFKLSSSGLYTITYRAEDTAGNITVKSYGIRVNDKTAPSIVIEDEDRFGGNIEVGEFFEVPMGNLIKDGVVLDDRVVYWDVTCSDGAICDIQSTGFTPLTAGTYYVKYYGSDGYGNSQLLQDNSLFYVNAKDTTAPVFNDDSRYILPPTMAWVPVKNNSTKVDEMTIDIPVVYATDPIRKESVEVVCTVTAPDGSKVTIQEYDTTVQGNEDKTDVKYFIATKQGKYKIEYQATDSANNKVTMTKELALGDCEAPTLSWIKEGDEGKDSPETTNKVRFEQDLTVGSQLKLDHLSYLLEDNVTTNETDLREKVNIKLLKPDGTVLQLNEDLSTERYSYWDLKDVGAYTLSITVQDEALISDTYKYTINVKEKTPENSVIDSTVGTVLIVASVVVLAGVVVYFVLSSRKKTTSNKSGRSRKKD